MSTSCVSNFVGSESWPKCPSIGCSSPSTDARANDSTAKGIVVREPINPRFIIVLKFLNGSSARPVVGSAMSMNAVASPSGNTPSAVTSGINVFAIASSTSGAGSDIIVSGVSKINLTFGFSIGIKSNPSTCVLIPTPGISVGTLAIAVPIPIPSTSSSISKGGGRNLIFGSVFSKNLIPIIL